MAAGAGAGGGGGEGGGNGGGTSPGGVSAATAAIGPHHLGVAAAEEAMWQMTLGGGESMESSPYPERIGEPDCSYYMRTGLCRFGMTCKFNHPPNRKLAVAAARMNGEYPYRIGQPECQYYLKTGTCKFGATCKFHHPREKAALATHVQLNVLGYPLRPSEKECAYYLRTGQCKFASTCKFHHPQPSNTMVAVRSSMYSPGQSATSPGQHTYPGAVTNWTLSRSASFIASPRWPGHSGYAQVIVPQGLVQVPGWNPYAAQMGSSSPDDQQRTPVTTQYYGSRQSETGGMGDHGMYQSYQGGSVPVSVYTVQGENIFPERPDQPECQFYMKTGDCKFGAVCKFHHPKERLVPAPNCALNSLGLPLRPGEPVCTFYSRYGICKFGPNCKFDHPMGTLMYGTATSPTGDVSSMHYQLSPSPGHSGILLDGGSGRSHRVPQSDSQQIPSGDGNTEREAS
uniref:C3H1-type domain-containing protein n=1 Tax=Oryza punctata TaxID=4537 RepID=A0A0E0MLM2_ORYPU